MGKYLDLLHKGKDATMVVASAEMELVYQYGLIQDTILYAFRYALGKSSYCVNDMCVHISSLKNELNDNILELIKKEIKRYLQDSPTGFTHDWIDLLKELEGHPKSYSMSTLETHNKETNG